VTLDEQKATALALRRQSALLLLTVCGLGLLLSSVGLHGVTSYGVRRRARELGIRMALSAASHDVLTMVVRQALWLAASRSSERFTRP
jgi:ABC-type antimicrobial peptide transport system permease subunit